MRETILINICFSLLLTAEEAESQWKARKLKYVRQGKITKAPSKSGSSTREAQEAKGNLDVYKLMPWLDEFVQTRRRKSNLRKSNTNSLTEDLEEKNENATLVLPVKVLLIMQMQFLNKIIICTLVLPPLKNRSYAESSLAISFLLILKPATTSSS